MNELFLNFVEYFQIFHINSIQNYFKIIYLYFARYFYNHHEINLFEFIIILTEFFFFINLNMDHINKRNYLFCLK